LAVGCIHRELMYYPLVIVGFQTIRAAAVDRT